MDDAVRPNPRTMKMDIELGMNSLVLVMIDDRVLNVRNLLRNKDRDLIGIIASSLIVIIEKEIGIKSVAPESKIIKIMTNPPVVITITKETIAIIVSPMIKTRDMAIAIAIAITIILNNQ